MDARDEFRFGYFAPFSTGVMIHGRNNDTYLIIHPIAEHWTLSITIDGFFPCRMDICRKICKMIFDNADEDAGRCFKTLADILKATLAAMQEHDIQLSYIKRMKRNIDYIERMAKDG